MCTLWFSAHSGLYEHRISNYIDLYICKLELGNGVGPLSALQTTFQNLLQYSHLIPAIVDRTPASAWMYKHHWITCH